MGVTSKIVGVTGNSRGEDRDEFMSAGIDAFHVKPITRTALISILEDIGGHWNKCMEIEAPYWIILELVLWFYELLVTVQN